MSDTPRTDAARHDEHDPYMAIAAECSKLERELNAANQRIKRLEEAGDELVDYNIGCGCGCGQDGPCRACRLAIEAWNAAKEAKP